MYKIKYYKLNFNSFNNWELCCKGWFGEEEDIYFNVEYKDGKQYFYIDYEIIKESILSLESINNNMNFFNHIEFLLEHKINQLLRKYFN